MTDLSQTLVDIARAGAGQTNQRAREIRYGDGCGADEAIRRATVEANDFRELQASGAFDFKFEEMGLEIEASGFFAGSFNGTARITYHNDKEDGLSWFVHEIYLDCSKWNGETWDVLTIEIEQHNKLYIDLWGVLVDGAFKDLIDAQVRGQL